MYVKILDREGQVLYKRNMPNNFALFKKILTPFLPDSAVGVESTFNYYWLYDGCVESGVPFYLCHAAHRRIQYATGADDLKQSFSLNLEYRVRRRKRKDCSVFLMQNQIKVDKNRKGILFSLVEDPPSP
jgi:hypothetical protein